MAEELRFQLLFLVIISLLASKRMQSGLFVGSIQQNLGPWALCQNHKKNVVGSFRAPLMSLNLC